MKRLLILLVPVLLGLQTGAGSAKWFWQSFTPPEDEAICPFVSRYVDHAAGFAADRSSEPAYGLDNDWKAKHKTIGADYCVINTYGQSEDVTCFVNHGQSPEFLANFQKALATEVDHCLATHPGGVVLTSKPSDDAKYSQWVSSDGMLDVRAAVVKDVDMLKISHSK